MKHKRIYFDNAASTKIDKRVLRAMKPYLTYDYGNPSSTHQEGRKARMAVTNARVLIADLLRCRPDEIFFTSGASESNSWISKMHKFDCAEYSHDSMLLANDGVSKSKFVSLPLIDSETGDEHEVDVDDYDWVHVDLTQAIGKVPIYLCDYNYSGNSATFYFDGNDMVKKCQSASFSAHKFGGPKGVGVLFVRKKYQDMLVPLIYGHQENGLRGGTENVAGIVGMAKALEIAIREQEYRKQHINKLATYIIVHAGQSSDFKLVDGFPLFLLNVFGDVKVHSNSSIINIMFKYLDAQSAVQIFDQYGIAVSAGSACNSDSDEPSRTLLYYGYSEEDAKKTIRVSLSHQNTLKECKKFIKVLRKIIDKYDVS